MIIEMTCDCRNMPGKTYGEKPIVFKFSEDGEEYMIGSEVSLTYLLVTCVLTPL